MAHALEERWWNVTVLMERRSRLYRDRMDVRSAPGLRLAMPIHHPGLCHATVVHRTGAAVHRETSVSIVPFCPKDLIMALKMGAETIDDMEGNRLWQLPIEELACVSTCCKLRPLPKAGQSSASVSSTRSKTRLMFRWGSVRR